MGSIISASRRAVRASRRLAQLSSDARNGILDEIAQALRDNSALLIKANERDVNEARKKGLSEGLIDRLLLTKERIEALSRSIIEVQSLKEVVGEIIESSELKNGIFLKRVRVPLGVIAMIYEARPNVTVDAAVLAIKSGNAILLKGGSEALHTNKALVKIFQTILEEAGALDPAAHLQDAVQLLGSDRAEIKKMLNLHGLIDAVIPRGGKNLIQFVRENSRIPVIETGASVVHTYVHEDADIDKAVGIVMNEKLRRVSICNTLDTLLLHEKCAQQFLERFVLELPKNPYKASHLELRADARSINILKKIPSPKKFSLAIKKASLQDWSTEFLDYVMGIKVVADLPEALEHIEKYSLKHSEAIVTEDRLTAERFLANVDAACVYWNASTQFSDGGEFGLGAEMGISTQKLHVRGPFALEGLTSYKWIVEGSGQIRRP